MGENSKSELVLPPCPDRNCNGYLAPTNTAGLYKCNVCDGTYSRK